MRFNALLLGLLAALAVSCAIDDPDGSIDALVSSKGYTLYYASVEEACGPGTRVYADADARLRWDADDRITVFNGNTYNQQFRFTGAEGDWTGVFALVPPAATAVPLDSIYAVYPYRDSTAIDPESGLITLQLPDIQRYRPDSFGPGANMMVAKTSGDHLAFKNVGAFLTFRLYGADVAVSSLVLKGRGSERLAGKGTLDLASCLPVLTMADDATDEVRVYCDSAVVLGPSAENCKEFWFVLPPVTFSQGFTLTVYTDDGGVFEQSTTQSKTITRNTILRMNPFEVRPSAPSLLNITKVSTVVGKTDGQPGKTYTARYDAATRTYTLTLPTVTDFSQLVLNCSYKGQQLKADGQVIQNGVTPVDASAPSADPSKPSSKEVILAACSGDREARYRLVVRNTGLPVVRITTRGFSQRDIERDPKHEIWRPTDEEQAASAAFAAIRVEQANGALDCETEMQLRGRGNASWMFAKRPFALKLAEKTSVLGMSKHKRWVLLANWTDRTLLRNDAAFWLSRRCEFPYYTVNGQHVELEFNGVHLGNYYLCEQIKIDKKRVNIKEMDEGESDPDLISGGYLMEVDNAYDEAFKFISDRFRLKYMFKEPDSLSTEAFDYMKGFINELERRIWSIHDRPYDASYAYPYRELLDMDSAIWFLFINELTGNGDFFNAGGRENYGPHSTYLYKDRNGKDASGQPLVSKLFMGPVWDFDYLTFVPGRSQRWTGANQGCYYFNYLYQDPLFKVRMLELWDTYKDAFAQLPDYLDQMAEHLRLSEEINSALWGTMGPAQELNGDSRLDYDAAISRMKSAFLQKLDFMDNHLSGLDYTTPSRPTWWYVYGW